MKMNEFLMKLCIKCGISHETCMEQILKEFPLIPTGNAENQTGVQEDDGAS